MRTISRVQAERINELNSKDRNLKGQYVLYWMQAAHRTEENPALEFAIQRANEYDLPLVVAFCLTPNYPEASLRHYTFMLEGLFETFDSLSALGAFPVLRTGSPPVELAALAEDASVAILDCAYLRHIRSWYSEFLSKVSCKVWQVEGEAVVPVGLASTKVEYAARTIRPRIKRHLDDFLVRTKPSKVNNNNAPDSINPWDMKDDMIADFLKDLGVDREVKPVSEYFRGGPQKAKVIYSEFLDSWFQDYDVQRNQPQTDYTSTMSPYLHYGQISAVDLAMTMLERFSADDQNVESYLEELLIRRGLSQNFTQFEPNYDSYKCLPGWAVKTLSEHSGDDRPDLYNRQQIEEAQTHDPYWNAAQVEMVETGYMHNYMRMYWGKKILEWSASPQEAYETTLYLNNKYFLDGRGPASFGNVAWIYGVHDRAWQERAIYGKIRCMMASGLERKSDPKAYVSKIEELTGREVEGKTWLC